MHCSHSLELSLFPLLFPLLFVLSQTCKGSLWEAAGEQVCDDKCSGKVNIVDGTKKKSASLKGMQRDVGEEWDEEEYVEVQVDKQGGRRE